MLLVNSACEWLANNGYKILLINGAAPLVHVSFCWQKVSTIYFVFFKDAYELLLANNEYEMLIDGACEFVVGLRCVRVVRGFLRSLCGAFFRPSTVAIHVSKVY